MPRHRSRPPDPNGEPPSADDVASTRSSEPLSLKDTFGTAVGAAMLGLEQALRDGPPPQIKAAEQTPDERRVVGSADLTIEFPERHDQTDEEEPQAGSDPGAGTTS